MVSPRAFVAPIQEVTFFKRNQARDGDPAGFVADLHKRLIPAGAQVGRVEDHDPFVTYFWIMEGEFIARQGDRQKGAGFESRCPGIRPDFNPPKWAINKALRGA